MIQLERSDLGFLCPCIPPGLMSSQPFTAFTDRGREGESAAPQPGCTAQQPTAVLAQQDHVIREHEQSLGALANSVSTLRTMLIKSKLRWHYLTVFILVLILVILVWIRIGQ